MLFPVALVVASLAGSPQESGAPGLAAVDGAPAEAGRSPAGATAAERLGALLEGVWTPRPEWADMLVAILKDEALDEGKGWWRPAGCLYGWTWLREHCDADGDGRVGPAEAPGVKEHFERLDRDDNGFVEREDLEEHAASAPPPAVEALFGSLDHDGNDRLSWDEVSWFFQQADRRKRGFITRRDLAAALPDLAPEKEEGREEDRDGREGNGAEHPGVPAKWGLLRLFVRGELGSFREGPALGSEAPDIALPSLSTGEVVRLTRSRGKRPVVLIFGSFT